MSGPEARRAALHLRLQADGVTGAAELARALGVDGSTMRRLVAGDPRILAIGQPRARRYALRRVVRGVDAPIPVHALDAEGRAHAVAALEPIEPRGFAVVFTDGRLETTDDLPYFLRDLCPAGFLGRAYARGAAARLGLPDDLSRWTLDDHVRALVDDGAEGPGCFVLGARALERALTTPAAVPIPRADRAEAYPRLAARTAASAVCRSARSTPTSAPRPRTGAGASPPREVRLHARDRHRMAAADVSAHRRGEGRVRRLKRRSPGEARG